MRHLNNNPNKTYRNEGKGWIAAGTGVEKPRLNLSQALRSIILIEVEKSMSKGQKTRENKVVQLSARRQQGHMPRGQVTSVILGRVLNAILIEF